MQSESTPIPAGKQTILLLATYFTLLSFGKSFHLPLLALAFLGGLYMLRNRVWTKQASQETKLLIYLFLSIYIPACFSLYSAGVPSKTTEFLLTYPLFALMGYFLATQLSQRSSLLGFTKWLNLLILIWGLSAVWQLLSPHESPFGPSMNLYQGMHSRYTSYGIDGGLMLGIILSGILPFVALSNLHHFGKIAALVLLCGTLFLIVISGTRSAIIATVVGLTICAVYLAYHHQVRGKTLVTLGLLITVAVGVAAKTIPFPQSVLHKVEQTTALFEELSFESANYALSGRLELWHDAINVGSLSPVTGKGVNSFRYNQPLVTTPDSSFVAEGGTGATHTHQLILEVWAGAGALGLLGLICFFGILVVITARAVRTKSLLAVGAIGVVWATFFPFNTHNHFYGSWLSGWLWVWLGVSLALIRHARIKSQST